PALLAALALATAWPLPAAAGPPPAYFVDESKLPFDALPGTSTTRLWGIHNGAGYRVEVPDDWNGELVLYAHGFRGTGLELTVSNPRIRQHLVQNGYAWAASSYSKNGYDVKQGVKDTHALGQRFNGLVGHPRRTWITGHSMGGHITGVAIEQYPNAYAGALPMCGVMGDNELFDYFLDFNLVAQALASVQAEFPFPADYQTAVVPGVKAALGPAYPAVLNAQGLKLRGVTQNISGGPRPAFTTSFIVWGNFLFTVGVTGGDIGVAPGNVQDNADTIYQIDADPALSPDEETLNAAVLRIAQDPQGRHPDGLANIPAISGRLPIPVLSIHTIGDLFVPFSMEQIYARRAAAEGAAHRLVSRAIRDHGHCGFAVVEEAQAFTDLVNWVVNGMKPAGDDILNPAAVADPNFGCQFSVPGHAGFAACGP
ncbi:MAG: alpha/beta hydrolase family protein, partial [Candidatus Rokuibacteriota bacterium]